MDTGYRAYLFRQEMFRRRTCVLFVWCAAFGADSLTEPIIPFFKPVTRTAGYFKDGESGIKMAGMSRGGFHVKIQIGEQVDFIQDHGTGTVEEERVLFGLIVAYGEAEEGDLGILATIELHRADKISHVFNEQDIDFAQVERPQRFHDKIAVEMTAAFRVDLHSLSSGGGYTLGVVVRLEIAFDNGHAELGGKIRKRPFE